MRNIVLASASPRRSELLNQIGLKFEVIPSSFEETFEAGLAPEQIVCDLALGKAKSVAEQLNGDKLVIGADTIVVGKTILGKPASREDAYRMLKLLQGRWHEVITGIAVIDCNNMKQEVSFERTRVKMRNMTDAMIYGYIDSGEPMDKAGAYGIQGMGALLVEKIEGCYFNVVGLPLTRLSYMLEGFGLSILG